MKKYEGMFIIKPDMNKDDLKKATDYIEKAVIKSGGRIEKLQRWARRRLAYSIKKYMEGEYYICDFETEPKNIDELKKTYRLSEDILRFLIILKG